MWNYFTKKMKREVIRFPVVLVGHRIHAASGRSSGMHISGRTGHGQTPEKIKFFLKHS
jgi:hypothetical protein